MKLFEDRVALVTGASQGIGESIARSFAREGASVVLLDVQRDKLEAVAAVHRRRGRQGPTPIRPT